MKLSRIIFIINGLMILGTIAVRPVFSLFRLA